MIHSHDHAFASHRILSNGLIETMSTTIPCPSCKNKNKFVHCIKLHDGFHYDNNIVCVMMNCPFDDKSIVQEYVSMRTGICKDVAHLRES